MDLFTLHDNIAEMQSRLKLSRPRQDRDEDLVDQDRDQDLAVQEQDQDKTSSTNKSNT